MCALSAHTQKCLSYKPKLVAESHTHKLPHCHIFQVLSSSRTFSSITAAWIAICLKLAKNSFNIFLLVFFRVLVVQCTLRLGQCWPLLSKVMLCSQQVPPVASPSTMCNYVLLYFVLLCITIHYFTGFNVGIRDYQSMISIIIISAAMPILWGNKTDNASIKETVIIFRMKEWKSLSVQFEINLRENSWKIEQNSSQMWIHLHVPV